MALSFLSVTGTTSPRAERNENLHHITRSWQTCGSLVFGLDSSFLFLFHCIHLLCNPRQIIFEGKVLKQPLSFGG